MYFMLYGIRNLTVNFLTNNTCSFTKAPTSTTQLNLTLIRWSVTGKVRTELDMLGEVLFLTLTVLITS